MNMLYGPDDKDVFSVISYLRGIGDNVIVEPNAHGDMIRVTADVSDIEQYFGAELSWHSHITQRSTKRSLRATTAMRIPPSIAAKISFISLNSPVNHAYPSKSKAPNSLETAAAAAASLATASANTVTTSIGNNEIVLIFSVTCADGSINNFNPPCSNTLEGSPVIEVVVTKYGLTSNTNVFPLGEAPQSFSKLPADVFCYDAKTYAACNGNVATATCSCRTKVGPIDKYVQLKANVTASFSGGTKRAWIGTSDYAISTDVATVRFLSNLYNMPAGLSVKHNSTQAVAEWYGEYYSNADLAAFLSLSGLPPATISDDNVFLSNSSVPNDQSDPGGEAQLDVEYIMGLAPGAVTSFYSIDSLNPYSSENENFLVWLYMVGNQTDPPLVQSLSYGDLEANIFNSSNAGSSEYADRCDQGMCV